MCFFSSKYERMKMPQLYNLIFFQPILWTPLLHSRLMWWLRLTSKIPPTFSRPIPVLSVVGVASLWWMTTPACFSSMRLGPKPVAVAKGQFFNLQGRKCLCLEGQNVDLWEVFTASNLDNINLYDKVTFWLEIKSKLGITHELLETDARLLE